MKTSRFHLACILFSFELASMATLRFTAPDDTYFLICGAFAVGSILGFHWAQTSQLSYDLERLALLGLVTQFFGWVSYWLYFPMGLYNSLTYGILVLQVGRLFAQRSQDEVREPTNSAWNSLLCSGAFIRFATYPEKTK
jgi:hypothetical protein